jgi:hypothetical protein
MFKSMNAKLIVVIFASIAISGCATRQYQQTSIYGSSDLGEKIEVDTLDFNNKYRSALVQSAIFGPQKQLDPSTVLGDKALQGAVTGLVVGTSFAVIAGNNAQSIVNSAAGGLIVGLAGGLVAGAIMQSINRSTIECLDSTAEFGPKMECASSTVAHIFELYKMAGFQFGTPIFMNSDNTFTTGWTSVADEPLQPIKLSDGSMGVRFMVLNATTKLPTVVTMKAIKRGEDYLEKYPATQGFEWFIVSVLNFSKPVPINRDDQIDFVAAEKIISEPGNIIKPESAQGKQ